MRMVRKGTLAPAVRQVLEYAGIEVRAFDGAR